MSMLFSMMARGHCIPASEPVHARLCFIGLAETIGGRCLSSKPGKHVAVHVNAYISHSGTFCARESDSDNDDDELALEILTDFFHGAAWMQAYHSNCHDACMHELYLITCMSKNQSAEKAARIASMICSKRRHRTLASKLSRTAA